MLLKRAPVILLVCLTTAMMATAQGIDKVPAIQKIKPQPQAGKANIKPITIKNSLAATDPLDFQRRNSYFKVHTVKMHAGTLYSLSLTANFTPYIRIEDHRGNQRGITNRFGARAVTLDFTPTQTESYRIIVTTTSTRQTGNYTLNINAKKTVFVAKGQLTVKDKFDTVRPRCYAKVHLVKLKAGNTYILHCRTTINDGWLRLEDSNKRQLGSNDDYMDTRNSRIVFTATKTDTYRVIITTCGSGTTGPYVLTITN